MLKKIFLLSMIFFLSISVNASTIDKFSYLDTKIVLFPIHKVVLSSLVETTIKTYKIKDGQNFRKGQILILLDDRLYEQAYKKSKVKLSLAAASFKYATNVYENNKELYKKEAVGSQELEKTELEKIEAQVNYETAKSNLTIAKFKLDACIIKAPFSGRFIKKIVFANEYVRSGEPIAEIVDDSNLLAVMNMPSNVLKNIKINDVLNFKIDELNEVYSGKINSISGSINPRSRTFKVKILINNKYKKLRVGMSGVLITK